MSKETYSVLMADDSAEDRMILGAALKQSSRLRLVGETADGAETIAYLKGEARYGDRGKYPFPDLLLLDLIMPVKDGFEVLRWLRRRAFEHLTVVALTGTMQPENIKRALDLGADLFQVKPGTNSDRRAMVGALESYLTRAGGAARPHTPLNRLRAAHQAGAEIY